MRNLLLSVALLAACKGAPEPEPSPLLSVPSSATWEVAGLHAPAYVLWTEAGIPHIYATNREDLHRVQGFVVATDRYFLLEMVRRLSTGRLSELLGDVVLDADMEVRAISQTWITDRILANVDEDQGRLLDAYAAGINDYIAAVRAGQKPPPAELELAANLLGAAAPADLMHPWTRRDVVALLGTIVFRLGYETHEPGRQADWLRSEGLFTDGPLADLRRAGLFEDIWWNDRPAFEATTHPEWDWSAVPANWEARRGGGGAPPPLNVDMLDRLAWRLDRVRARNGRDRVNGYGSNAWAVMGSKTADGRALFAGDGHLELDIPPLLYQIHLDTAHLGGGDTHIHGNLLAGAPFPAIGTNGKVAWTTTQHMGDITDWYGERIQLGTDGKPAATWFQGAWKPLTTEIERFEVATLPPPIDSAGGTVEVERWVLFDGRWLANVEGNRVPCDNTPNEGEAVVNFAGDCVIPRDMDNDGIISGVSFDFTGLDGGNLFKTLDAFGHAESVEDMRVAHSYAVALSQNVAAADASGSIYVSGYQTVPCRGYLPREADGRFIEGANPQLLIDGTTYGGFTVPVGPDMKPIEGETDPYRCIIPQDHFPWLLDPARGFAATANNDPAKISLDGSVFNEPVYIGGGWDGGWRADRIERVLEGHIAAGTADIAAMADLQADDESLIARQFSAYLLDAVARIRALEAGEAPAEGSSDARALALYQARKDRIDEVTTRLTAWQEAGWPARSGVATFYDPLLPGDTDHAVATTLWNVWIGDFVRDTLADEAIPGEAWFPGSTDGQLRMLEDMLRGRGEGNPAGLGCWNPDTLECAFFDLRDTEEIEQSDEIALLALHHALDFLASAPTGDDEGGFGTEDMNKYLWGLRHQVKFESLIGAQIDDPAFGAILRDFSITTAKLPLDPGLTPVDPRAKLEWFPRKGDNRGVDAANNGLSGRSFQYGSGPVNRMVYALGPEGVEGQEILPGGQSGLPSSPHFADQAAMWLANEALPIRFTVEDVVAHATRRETFSPAAE